MSEKGTCDGFPNVGCDKPAVNELRGYMLCAECTNEYLKPDAVIAMETYQQRYEDLTERYDAALDRNAELIAQNHDLSMRIIKASEQLGRISMAAELYEKSRTALYRKNLLTECKKVIAR